MRPNIYIFFDFIGVEFSVETRDNWKVKLSWRIFEHEPPSLSQNSHTRPPTPSFSRTRRTMIKNTRWRSLHQFTKMTPTTTVYSSIVINLLLKKFLIFPSFERWRCSPQCTLYSPVVKCWVIKWFTHSYQTCSINWLVYCNLQNHHVWVILVELIFWRIIKNYAEPIYLP